MKEVKSAKKLDLVLITVVAVAVLSLLVFILYINREGGTPEVVQEETVSEVEETTEESTTDEDALTEEDTETESEETTEEEVDTDAFSSIAITPLGVEVFYTKGIPGFSFQVLRSNDGTRYVEFLADDLVGTKCTHDEGVFVTIIEDADDVQNYAATTTVDATTYGLLLASTACTGDADLLAEYQDAFQQGFSSLRTLED